MGSRLNILQSAGWDVSEEDIFKDDVDRQDFLKTLAEACQKTGCEVHAWSWDNVEKSIR
jgi:hypothetical protein